MDENNELLEKAIKRELERLDSCSDNDERTKIVKNIETLRRLRIDEKKIDTERDSQEAQRKDRKWDLYLNIGMQGLMFLGSMIAYDCWNRRGLKFEETGTVTSPHTRNLLSKMIPKLKN